MYLVLNNAQHDTILPIQKYEVSSSATERKQLTKIVKSDRMPARAILRANVFLAVDKNGKKPMTVLEAALAFSISSTTVQNVHASYRERPGCNRKQKEAGDTPSKPESQETSRLTLSPWPAGNRPRAKPKGRSAFSPTIRSNWDI